MEREAGDDAQAKPRSGVDELPDTDARDAGGALDKDKGTPNVYDSALKTLYEHWPKLFIPLVNHAFGMNLPFDTPIRKLSTEHMGETQHTIADYAFDAEGKQYHIELESTFKPSMGWRMYLYDSAMSKDGTPPIVDGTYDVFYPRSCVVFLRGSKTKNSMIKVRVHFADGQVTVYSTPTLFVKDYSLDELFEYRLYLLLPFYLMRHTDELDKHPEDESLRNAIIRDANEIIARLKSTTLERKETAMYNDFARVILNVSNHVLRKQATTRKEVGSMLRGEIMAVPSDALREERSKGRAEGKAEGKAEGRAEERGSLVESFRAVGVSEELIAAALELANSHRPAMV